MRFGGSGIFSVESSLWRPSAHLQQLGIPGSGRSAAATGILLLGLGLLNYRLGTRFQSDLSTPL